MSKHGADKQKNRKINSQQLPFGIKQDYFFCQIEIKMMFVWVFFCCCCLSSFLKADIKLSSTGIYFRTQQQG